MCKCKCPNLHNDSVHVLSNFLALPTRFCFPCSFPLLLSPLLAYKCSHLTRISLLPPSFLWDILAQNKHQLCRSGPSSDIAGQLVSLWHGYFFQVGQALCTQKSLPQENCSLLWLEPPLERCSQWRTCQALWTANGALLHLEEAGSFLPLRSLQPGQAEHQGGSSVTSCTPADLNPVPGGNGHVHE